MKEIVKKVRVDLLRRNKARLVFATQNDCLSRAVEVELTCDGEPYSVGAECCATANFLLSDGTSGACLGEIVDGDVFFVVPMWALGVVGEVKCSVTLTDVGGKRLTSAPFSLEVEAELYSGSEIAEDSDYTLLTGLLAEMAAFSEAEAERASAEEARAQAEAEKASAEEARAHAEAERVSVEEARAQNEVERQSAESARAVAEQSRCEAEAQREAAEAARAEAEAEREALVGDIGEALEEIIAVQEGLIPRVFYLKFFGEGLPQTLKFISGWTWGDWVNSRFNTIDAFLYSGGVYLGVSAIGTVQYGSSDDVVSPSDLIIADEYYYEV